MDAQELERGAAGAAGDDLLTPTLGAEYDRLVFSRPWRPWGLALATFFGGIPTAAILYPLNYRRLGQPRAAGWTLVGLLLFGVLLTVGNVLYVRSGGFAEWTSDVEARRWARHVQTATGLVPALWLSARQQRRFRLFEAGGGAPGRLLWPALGAIAAGFVVTLGLGIALVAVLGSGR